MEENIAAVLSYAGGWATGLIFLVMDRRPKVRFQAAQSVIVFGALNVVYIVFRIVAPDPVVDALWLITIAAWAFLMYKAYQSAGFKVPIAAELVEPLLKKSASLTGDEEPQSTAPKAFNPNEPALPQVVKQVGVWTPDDAAKALGAPARDYTLPDDVKAYTYFYTSGSGERIEVDLGFATPTSRLSVVMVTPFDLLFDAIRPKLYGQLEVIDNENGVRTYHFTNLHVACVVDQAGKIFKIIVDGKTSVEMLEWLSSVASFVERSASAASQG